MSTFKLRGSRVLLNCPPRKDLGLHLSAEAEQELLIEELKSMTALEVFAVGDNVQDIQVGNKVYVSPSTIMHAELVKVDEEEKFLIREMDVALIW
jgi:histidinol phosphatase-like enzyme